MNYQWLVVLPPLIVVALVALTRRIFPALIIGIVSAALIYSQFDVMLAGSTIVERFLIATEFKNFASVELFWTSQNLFVGCFLLILGVFIMLLRYSGAAYAYGTFVSGKLTSATSAQMASLCMSLFFFIDDYFSSLTVGCVMQPITDRYKIPRVKLALLVNTVAAPLAIMVPITSWAAQIMAQMRNSGVAFQSAPGAIIIGDPFMMYMHIIPFLFYSMLVLTAIWFFVYKKYSFGIFAQHEKIAATTGNLFAGKIPVMRHQSPVPIERQNDGHLVDFVLPLIFLFGAVFAWMLRTGNATLLGGCNDFVTALQQANTFESLMIGGLIAVTMSFIFLFFRKRILINELPAIVKEGCSLMSSSIMVLILIWTFGGLVTHNLKTGQYLAQFLIGSVPSACLPVMFFAIASVVSVMMGSAWGTISMLFPLGIPMVVSMAAGHAPLYACDLVMLYPVLGAIISGAVVGNHLSPISDVMLMSAASAGAYHMDLYKAQVSFSIPSIIATAVSFGVVGIMLGTYSVAASFATALFVGVVLNTMSLIILNYKNMFKV